MPYDHDPVFFDGGKALHSPPLRQDLLLPDSRRAVFSDKLQQHVRVDSKQSLPGQLGVRNVFGKGVDGAGLLQEIVVKGLRSRDVEFFQGWITEISPHDHQDAGRFFAANAGGEPPSFLLVHALR